MKKALSLLLAATLAFSLVLPAGAEEAALDSRLADVTLKVKNTLGLDDSYTDFYGNLYDNGLNSYWRLNWQKDGETLNVSADSSGKIFEYNRYEPREDIRYSDGFAPKFPSVTRADAVKATEAFLATLLDKNESVRFEEPQVKAPYDTERYYFGAFLYVNGVESPVRISITVRTDNLSVSDFYRSDFYDKYIGGYPSATPRYSAADAKAKLDGTVEMKLQYVIETETKKETGETASHAVLRYIPVTRGSFVFDAQTGELVDLSSAYENLYRGASGAAPAAAETADMAAKELSPVERAGIAKLEGVLTESKMDEAVRAIPELKLHKDFVLGTVRYNLNNETGDVSAYLNYSLKVDIAKLPGLTKEERDAMASSKSFPFIRKSVTVDAKTGELISLYTNYPYGYYKNGEERKVTDKMKETAAAFLEKYHGGKFAKTVLSNEADSVYAGYSGYAGLSYVRHENDIPVPQNVLDISVDENGAVDRFSYNWTDNVTFDSPDGIVSADAAHAAYAGAYKAKLAYIPVPTALDPDSPEHRPMIEYGYNYLHKLILGYSLYSEKNVYGVDPKTGEVLVSETNYGTTPRRYTDIEGSYAKAAIEALADYGIGFPGSEFKPAMKLTQRDMLVFLLSADGYGAETDDEFLYSRAFSMGILKKSEKAPDKLISRAELAKIIVRMSGYGKAAELPGIYVCAFKDASAIPAADLGYIAIAQGLGVIKGDANGNFRPASVATRAEAAMMLYNFMSRAL